MHFVLVAPGQADPAAASAALADTVGGGAYEHRQVLLRGLPFIAAWRDTPAQAHAVAATLTQAGLEAWAFDDAVLDHVPPVLDARAFRFAPDHLELLDRRGAATAVPLARVGLICRARALHASETTTETTRKKVRLGALAMGVPMSKSKTTREVDRTTEDEAFALLWSVGPDLCVRLSRDALDYEGLGDARVVSAQTNYLALLARLEAACPGARVDAALERAAGRVPPVPTQRLRDRTRHLRSSSVSDTVAEDNTDAVLFAARLLYVVERARRARPR